MKELNADVAAKRHNTLVSLEFSPGVTWAILKPKEYCRSIQLYSLRHYLIIYYVHFLIKSLNI